MKTIIDKKIGKVLFATADDNYQVLASEMAVDEILIDNFIKPFFNKVSRTFFEGATAQEIAELKVEPTKEELIKTIQSLESQLNEIKQQLNNL